MTIIASEVKNGTKAKRSLAHTQYRQSQCRSAKYHIVNPSALRESQRTQRVPTKAHQADKTAFQGHNKT